MNNVFVPSAAASPPHQADLLLATVASVDSTGLSLIFDGSAQATQKTYKYMPGMYQNPTAGDRVVAMKISGTYIILGAIGNAPTPPAANTVLAGVPSGNPAAATFRSLVAADLPIVPINKGGTGQSDLSITTDPSEVFVMASGFSCNRVFYAVWGKLAMVAASIKVVDAVTSTSWVTWATLVEGKRPPAAIAASLTRATYCIVGSDGQIQVSSTVNADSNYTFTAVYLLA